MYKEGQSISHSRIGGHYGNGLEENSIKMVNMSRVMMIYRSIRWPNCVEKYLCPMAIQNDKILYNNTLKMSTKMTPLEMWTRVKSRYSILINSHPWGCPVYVLDTKLQDGQKIPK